jgi:hypothetical protein
MVSGPPSEEDRCPICDVADGQQHMEASPFYPSVWTSSGSDTFDEYADEQGP